MTTELTTPQKAPEAKSAHTRHTESELKPSALTHIAGSAMMFRLAFVVTALLVWTFLSTTVLSTVLPTVPEIANNVYDLFTGFLFYEQMGLTIRRVFAAFALAYLIAFVIGVAMGRSRKVEAFFELFILTGLSQPGIFIAMIILIALGLRESSAIIAMAYLAIPLITVPLWQANKRLDTDLQDMSKVFGYSRSARLRHVTLPQLSGPAITAARQAFGISWKYVVVIELLGLSDGVGYQVNRAFQLYDMTAVVSWTISFMIFIALFEYLVLRPIERRIFLWRERPMGKFRGEQDTVIEEERHA